VAVQGIGALPSEKAEPDAGKQLGVTLPQQKSVAIEPKVAVACPFPVHSMVCRSGQAIVGGVVSTTFTCELQLEDLPEPSVAVQESGFVPSAKLEPDAGRQLGVMSPQQASLDIALNVALACLLLMHSAERPGEVENRSGSRRFPGN